ncbi:MULTISPECIES: ribonuclease P protein component [unclassified Leifsonia]|uniref:ribonuclease P protein component n=1 Tax=unclassified Leifsonia TaxID=2663824 RepID=UPI000A190515|nr:MULTISPECIES: ribonuclease P protein component [unclassified Leifsonia]QJA00495.1 ribonuclease P protein component [Leifsonia sp. PS1209]
MLAKANRITRGADYKATVRRGARFTGANTVTYIRPSPDPDVVRFGFIVGKTVGVAVRRNLVRRRLKAAAHELLPRMSPGTDIVIRALPASAQAEWATLHEEISAAISRFTSRGNVRR